MSGLREYANRVRAGGMEWREWMRKYVRSDAYWYRHHERFVAYVNKHGLLCQECGGCGSYHEAILDDGSGPTYSCGWCEGTGLVTRWGRGQWLRYKREEHREKLRRIV